jgi:hypothetical protein
MPEPSAPFSASPPSLTLGAGSAAYDDAVTKARDEGWAERLFAKDTSLWSSDPRVQQAISERLGWLDAPGHFTDRIAALEGFGEGTRDAGFTTAIVAGMGGSSLGPDVLARTFGADEDWLRCASSTRPTRRPWPRRSTTRPARDALHRRQQVRHDDRAAGLPRRRVGPDRGVPPRPPRAVRPRRRDDRRDLGPGRASRRSPTTTSSASSSSTRPTSAAGIPWRRMWGWYRRA